MEIDTIKLGEIYPISVSALDSAGDAITIDSGWSVACRITSCCVGGTTVSDVSLTIADGVATGSIDSGAILAVGKYFLDVRFTNEDGNPYWSEPWQLIVQTRNTPAS